jgi:hypothetical protein
LIHDLLSEAALRYGVFHREECAGMAEGELFGFNKILNVRWQP